jgi:hypothetical protein
MAIPGHLRYRIMYYNTKLCSIAETIFTFRTDQVRVTDGGEEVSYAAVQ